MNQLKIVSPGIKNHASRFCSKCGAMKLLVQGDHRSECPKCYQPFKEIAESYIKESNIPPMCHKGLSGIVRNNENAEFLSDCAKALQDLSLLQKGSWFLYGRTGCGKTFHAGSFGIELIRRRLRKVKFIQAAEYLNEIKGLLTRRSWQCEELNDTIPIDPRWASLSRESRTVEERLTANYEIERMPILIVDDFNRKYRDGFEKERIYDIVNHRYTNRLFTIFTAQDERLSGLDEQTSSRITHMSQPYFLGPENRRNK